MGNQGGAGLSFVLNGTTYTLGKGGSGGTTSSVAVANDGHGGHSGQNGNDGIIFLRFSTSDWNPVATGTYSITTVGSSR